VGDRPLYESMVRARRRRMVVDLLAYLIRVGIAIGAVWLCAKLFR
jgi:hypothetical protein